MAIPLVAIIPAVTAVWGQTLKDKRVRKIITTASIIAGAIILYPILKKTIQVSVALSPVTTSPQTDKPIAVPTNAEILARLYSWGGLETFIKELEGKGIQVIKVTTTRKSRIFVIDPKAIVWISKDGKTAYAEYITYV